MSAVQQHKIFLYKIIAGLLVAVLIGLSACTKHFEELNTDPTTFSSLTTATIPNAFAKAQYQGIYGDPGIYQLVRNLFVDYWSQYFAVVDPGIPTDRYVLRADWVFYQWGSLYSNAWPTLKLVLDATRNTDAEAYAIAKIWKVYIFHSCTDWYGPIPYSQAGNGELSVGYDSQEFIYDDMLKSLDSAVTTLKAADQARLVYGANDLIFGGSIPKWTKLGNTLRLRLAMRISGVDPARARTEAEAAVASGVLTSIEDNALMDVGPSSPNGLNLMSPWGGFRMSASMESFFKGYDDPRMGEYYSPAEGTGEYNGVRNGLSVAQLAASPKNQGTNLSNVGPRFDVTKANENKLTVMYAAEAYFLRAEGALNGWNMGGTPKDLYEDGIATSMRQWGVTAESAISAYTQGSSTPADLNDFLNSPAVSDIPVLFSTDPEIQREQVGTQKWIALYPDGIEAWAELRRTGYPRLYPLANSDNPDLPVPQIIRRFPYIESEYLTNFTAVQNAVSMLNGPDKPNTRVWWNVE
ncbi:SusD/RagB family nutrient-binding outer membrane lipoprotein [Flavihumibacter sp. UBA7668]|uniref:SusD/RagB family nutrient-binding outer membrane lipoprotein n=1 Tax=Flavihumibacter sp. UBA7668 TaxID=1946542 RepID=UPI0025C22F2C|nr:SusD/RagB family nutrient-binding outer membrane lipoprotein [Flavihumibacter sp. UBA7668]